ncbi:MAG: PLP-dependent aminotransferase family protein [Gammaproteobacteria bacterium]|nr:PLP-dependent aminotransferase family protein [Gammaproteobacteria bacterium]
MPETDRVFADRITDVPRSFIREILKVALDPGVISFAGGLPNRSLFPVAALKAATENVLGGQAADVLQYAGSEGYQPLREFIAARYRQTRGLDIPVDNILVTNGSQQGLDLLGKTLLNDGDGVVIEEPGYLGAIQAFSLYRPIFRPVSVSSSGMNVEQLRSAMFAHRPKLIYTVPNFQNPSGVSYPEDNRHEVAEAVAGTGALLIEDDPYGDLRFSGRPGSSFKSLLPEQTVMLGSFSKCIVPGLRLGWIVAPDDLLDKLVTVKQATDLHTSHFTQSIVHRYLADNDLDEHVGIITDTYGRQCQAMQRGIREHFPPDVACTEPEGGMFLWAALPEDLAAVDLFDLAVAEKVVFVPGDPFYVDGRRSNAMRLNFSCADEATIEIGMQRLGGAISKLLAAPQGDRESGRG